MVDGTKLKLRHIPVTIVKVGDNIIVTGQQKQNLTAFKQHAYLPPDSTGSIFPMSGTVMYFNCNSVLSKFNELVAVCLDSHPDIMCLVEAWLSDKPHCVAMGTVETRIQWQLLGT